ncbi:MAG TPA: TadE/TadG family type IV pilus assembly protein [Levilinea sp.]|nr:TadE/TadG family type IV pilus assembly protein [Levilinea sp.]
MKHHRSEKGQSLMELAISFTVLLLILGGLVDLGRVFFALIAIRDAAQEGAVYAAIIPVKSEANIRAWVRSSSNDPLDLAQVADSDIEIIAFNSSGNIAIKDACSGDQVTVTVTYRHRFIMPLTTGIAGSNPLPVRATITNTILQPLCP